MTEEAAFISDTFHLTHQRDGYWLWDKTRGMNLAMRSKSERDAFVEALQYYQKRLTTVEFLYKNLNEKVDAFVNSVSLEDEE